MVALAIAAGLAAKAEGLKTYTFDRAGDAFAKGYFADKTEGSAKAMISALNAFTEAGLHPVKEMAEVAVRCFNEKAKDGNTLSFSTRAGMVRKLLKLDHAPTTKEYSAARPDGGNRTGEGSLKRATAGLLRSVDAFGVKWMAKLDGNGKAMLADIRAKCDAFAKVYDVETAKPTEKKGKGKPAEPTFAEKRKAFLAELVKATPATRGSQRTVN